MSTDAPGGVVGVVPAAGFATRLQPLAGSKEALRVGGRPLLAHLLERLWLGGCTRVIVTTRPAKRDVAAIAIEGGAEVVFAEPRSVAASIVAALRNVPDGDLAVIGFPDTVWEPADALRPVVRAARERDEVILGLFPALDPTASDNVEVSRSGRVAAVVVKPERPRTRWTWGLAAARAHLLRGLEGCTEPGVFFDEAARAGRVSGLRFRGPYIDGGTNAGLSRLLNEAV
ncbi:MAG TPA: NTP transferase domain-containing protein [Gaiellaceae bacterium]|nr:NTP transferase domain-containing protein [Gaiellaceae bacterium]